MASQRLGSLVTSLRGVETNTQTVQVLGQKGPDVLQEQIDIAESVSERHRDTRNMKP